MAACVAVVSNNAALCALPGDPHGSFQGQQHLQLRSFRHSSATSLRMGSNGIDGPTSAGVPRQGVPGGCSHSGSSKTGIPRRNVAVRQGVAGVQTEASDEEAAGSRGLSVGQVTVQGLRDEMEDEAVVQDGPLGFTYAAVFDGHAGISTAQFLRDELYKECVESLKGGSLLKSDDQTAVQEALVHAFQQTDTHLLSCFTLVMHPFHEVQHNDSWCRWDVRLETKSEDKESGSTASVLFLGNDSVTIAHVGDSRAVLSQSGKAVDLSADHRPFGSSKTSISEINRVKEAGGWISHGRLCAMLSISRAFGDTAFKTHKREMLEQGIQQKQWTRPFTEKLNVNGNWLSVTPDVNQCQLDESSEFIILASDGLWDSFKSNDAVQFVRKQLKKHGDVQRAAEAIAQATLERRGQDNIAVIILDLGKVAQEEESGIRLKWW